VSTPAEVRQVFRIWQDFRDSRKYGANRDA